MSEKGEGKVNEWWLVVDKDGDVYACESEQDARNTVIAWDKCGPEDAPHRAVKVIAVDAVLEMINERITKAEHLLKTEDPHCEVTKGEISALEDLKVHLEGKK